MILPYDPEALWLKSKMFLNRAMEPGSDRAFEERSFWAAAALELLGKAALAKISPLLIADPKEDGKNILIAAGVLKGGGRFVSVSAATVFRRCARAFFPFDDDGAIRIANGRNEYMHGPGSGLTPLPEEQWWAQYWSLATTLVDAQDRKLVDLIGQSRVQIVESYLALNAKNIESRTQSLIARAKQRFDFEREGSAPAKVQADWAKIMKADSQLPYKAEQQCPACGSVGFIEGDETVDVEFDYDNRDDDGALLARVTVPSERFSCPACRLVLDSFPLIEQAGLPDYFETDDDAEEYMEPDYGND
ncbi:hypothetical protein [Kribbella sp. CA-294648]|uniref:hypothetical protein n=1 Tax=Kribbella sp. CA-294648 TaxID=3239948 RepID=UPI003D8A212C